MIFETLRCVYCKQPIGDGVHIGAGDGTGQKFAHEACYYRTRLSEANQELNRLKAGRLVAIPDELRQRLRWIGNVAYNMAQETSPGRVLTDDVHKQFGRICDWADEAEKLLK